MTHDLLSRALAEAVSDRLAEERDVHVSARGVAGFFAHRDFPDDHFWAAWDSNVSDMAAFYFQTQNTS